MVMSVIISSEMSRDRCCSVFFWFHYCESMFIESFSKLSACFTNVKFMTFSACCDINYVVNFTRNVFWVVDGIVGIVCISTGNLIQFRNKWAIFAFAQSGTYFGIRFGFCFIAWWV